MRHSRFGNIDQVFHTDRLAWLWTAYLLACSSPFMMLLTY